MQARWTHAVVVRGPGQTALERLDRPSPGPGEMLLRLRCCGLCGTDLYKIAHGRVSTGSVLGHEVVGTVTEVGDTVDAFEPAQRVVTPHHVPCGQCRLCRQGNETLCAVFREDLLVPGGFSEYFLVRPRAVAQAARSLPEDVSDEAAVFLEPAACVLRGVERAGLASSGWGEQDPPTALVLGAGSMGLLHLLLLRALDANLQVVVSDPLGERRRAAMRLGARAAVAPDEVLDTVRGVSAGLGADAVFDTAGRPAALRDALACSREGATTVLFAHGAPGDELRLDLNDLFRSERRLVGTYSSGPREQRRVWDLLRRRAFDPAPLISHRLPLSRFQEGVDLALAHQACKVLIVPDEEDEGDTP